MRASTASAFALAALFGAVGCCPPTRCAQPLIEIEVIDANGVEVGWSAYLLGDGERVDAACFSAPLDSESCPLWFPTIPGNEGAIATGLRGVRRVSSARSSC